MRRRVANILARTGLRAILEHARPWSGVVVLNYHRVGDSTGSLLDHGLFSSTEARFTDEIRFVRQHLDIITPADLATVRAARRGRYAVITFDDGYRDNHDVAFRILRSEGVPATFFVATGFIDTPTLPWWDEIAWLVRSSARPRLQIRGVAPVVIDQPAREDAVRTLLRAYKRLPTEAGPAFLAALSDAAGVARPGLSLAGDLWMTWDMLRSMRDGGMTIGGHTVTHPVLARATASQQKAEIEACARRLQQELGLPMTYFAYPVGQRDSFDATTRACLKDAGVAHAFSFYGGLCRFDAWDDYDLPRIPVEMDVTRPQFRATVTLPWLFA